MSANKKASRLRRARKSRATMRRHEAVRLQVHRSNRHIYAQVIDPSNKVLAAVSTRSKSIVDKIAYPGNIASAEHVGALIAELARKAGVSQVAFDRSGFKYHGRVKALAEKAREGGLEF